MSCISEDTIPQILITGLGKHQLLIFKQLSQQLSQTSNSYVPPHKREISCPHDAWVPFWQLNSMPFEKMR